MNLQKRNLTIQPRTKLEFARLFVGEYCSDQAARRWLRSELNTNPALLEQLSAIGYKTNTKLLTIKQQQIILEYFKVDFVFNSIP